MQAGPSEAQPMFTPPPSRLITTGLRSRAEAAEAFAAQQVLLPESCITPMQQRAVLLAAAALCVTIALHSAIEHMGEKYACMEWSSCKVFGNGNGCSQAVD